MFANWLSAYIYSWPTFPCMSSRSVRVTPKPPSPKSCSQFMTMWEWHAGRRMNKAHSLVTWASEGHDSFSGSPMSFSSDLREKMKVEMMTFPAFIYAHGSFSLQLLLFKDSETFNSLLTYWHPRQACAKPHLSIKNNPTFHSSIFIQLGRRAMARQASKTIFSKAHLEINREGALACNSQVYFLI